MPAKDQPQNKRRRVMVEFAQPNTHKDFHVGHLRNASIGQAIANLLEFAGHQVYKATYIGDVGLHVAKAMVGHAMGLNSADTASDRLDYWGRCYKAANARFEEPEIQSAVREWLLRWEEGSEPERAEWQTSRDECVAAFREIFSELQLSFTDAPDLWFYESTIDDTKLGQRTAQELLERGIAELDESEKYKGSLFVDFEKQVDALRPDGTPVFRDDEKKAIRRLGKMVILRSDGTSLYQTKELGLAKHKFDLIRETTGSELDESLYVVGAEQKLYFQQVLAILRLWGFPNAENCRHISYELVVLPEGKMSSREGTIVSYRELRDESIRRAEEVIREKGIITDEAQIIETARAVAIAAIKFTMLQVSGNQSIVFDMEQALSFSGRAAPYLQYAYARAGKLVKSAPGDSGSSSLASSLTGRTGAPACHPESGATRRAQLEDFEVYRRHMPHWRLSGSTYFVTWNLHPEQIGLSAAEKSLVFENLKHFDGERFELIAAVVMNDHVHLIVRPLGEWELSKILHGWKSFAANQLQKLFARTGAIWQSESMDRIIRDEEELYQKAKYIIENPLKEYGEGEEYEWLHVSYSALAGESGSGKETGRGACPTGQREDTGQREEPAAPVEVPAYELHATEVELARQISLFPEVIEAAAQKYEPAVLCNYLYVLASSFSDFYRDCRVLDAEIAEQEFRRALTRAFRQVMKNGFRILALPLPEEM